MNGQDVVADGRMYVKMSALYHRDGRPPTPTMFQCEDGNPVRIHKILGVCNAADRKIAGEGFRYACVVGGKRVTLVYDDKAWRWYVEQAPPSAGGVAEPRAREWTVFEHEGKAYVDVLAVCPARGGAPQPKKLWWEDGREYIIDSVSDVRRATSLRAGGVGLRYACQINGREKHLYFENAIQRWFVERKNSRCVADTTP